MTLRRHAPVGAAAHLLAHAAAAAAAAGLSSLLVALAKLIALGRLLFLAEITPGLRALHLDGLAVDLERHVNARLNAGLALERDEAKASRPPGVLIHHERGIDYTSKLRKEVAKFLVRCLLADAAHEDLARLFLLIARDGALGVDLRRCFCQFPIQHLQGKQAAVFNIQSSHPENAP